MGEGRNQISAVWMKVLLVCFMLHSSLFIHEMMAQDEPEYKMEVGAGIGLMNYLGDYNGSLLKQMQPMGGLVAKYKMNPRMAWAATLSYGQLKGKAGNSNTWYPEDISVPADFSTKLIDFNVKYEYNFWPFGTGREYYGAQPLTPFISLGGGLAFANGDKSVVAFQVPVGFGVKYKLMDRLNLTAEWLMHISGSDKLDGIRDPYGIKSSDLFKNTDCFTTLQLSLTYEFMEKCKTCHNDKE